jgi:hypothetical protein
MVWITQLNSINEGFTSKYQNSVHTFMIPLKYLLVAHDLVPRLPQTDTVSIQFSDISSWHLTCLDSALVSSHKPSRTFMMLALPFPLGKFPERNRSGDNKRQAWESRKDSKKRRFPSKKEGSSLCTSQGNRVTPFNQQPCFPRSRTDRTATAICSLQKPP